jgi:hypothetical protein
MKRTVIAAGSLWLGAIGMGAISQAQASPDNRGFECVARVLHSEELPYAPIGYWLAKVTLEVTPSNGPPFIRTLYNNVPLQRSSPRRGETFRLKCDPADSSLY